MKKYILMLICLVVVSTTAEAQFGKRLQNAVQRSAENAVTRKAEQKTTETVNKTIDKAFDPKTATKEEKAQHEKEQKEKAAAEKKAKQDAKKTQNQSAEEVDEEEDEEEVAAPKDTKAAIEMTYAKSDFVAGDEIIFDDPMAGEKLGEFPSQWDLLRGNAEVMSLGNTTSIFMEAPGTSLAPLMKNMKSYLPDIFTVELDYWVNNYTETHERPSQNYRLQFYNADDRNVMELEFAEGSVRWNYKTPDGESRYGSLDVKEKIDSWSHISVSFNKRAFKAYINGVRVTNIPSMDVPVRLSINRTDWRDHRCAITNFRIAKGAVPLYDRMMTDGKFITYGITFDVGKSNIKPESLGEINRIVTLMSENPDLKFSVEGHTDATGNAASNQTLSEARSKAIVDKLVEMGVASDRLSSAGKGQNSPLADNSTDEGRAKNRRVEFVKM